MANAIKANAVAGLGKQTVLGTSVPASQDLALISETLKAGAGAMVADVLTGSRAVDYLGRDASKCGGQIVEQLRYLLATDGAHILLEQAFGRAVGHVYRNLTREAWVPLRNGAADNVELSDAVTPAATASAGVEVWRFLKRTGTPAGGSTEVWIEIQTDAAGDASGTPVTNGTSIHKSATAISPDGEWVKFTFAISPTLTASTAYHIVLKGDYTVSATANISMAVETVASGGTFEILDAAWGNSATQNGVGRVLTTSFVDTYVMLDTIEGLYATVAIDKTISVHEYVGCKVAGCTLRSTPGADGLRATYEIVGLDEVASPLTTPNILRGLLKTRDFPLHHQMTACWIGDQIDALVAGDNVPVDSAEIKITRALDSVFASGSQTMLEPLENAQGQVTFDINIPRYSADTFRTWQTAGTALQARLQWVLSGKYVTILLPNLHIDGAIGIETGDRAPYSQKVSMRAFRNGAVNGLMQVSDEIELSILNV